jgi:hypothetical protein
MGRRIWQIDRQVDGEKLKYMHDSRQDGTEEERHSERQREIESEVEGGPVGS